MFWGKRSDVFVLPLPFYNDNIKEFWNYGLAESRNHGGFAKTTRQRVWRKPSRSLVVL